VIASWVRDFGKVLRFLPFDIVSDKYHFTIPSAMLLWFCCWVLLQKVREYELPICQRNWFRVVFWEYLSQFGRGKLPSKIMAWYLLCSTNLKNKIPPFTLRWLRASETSKSKDEKIEKLRQSELLWERLQNLTWLHSIDVCKNNDPCCQDHDQ
jgi:hypothetical protein